MGGRSTLKTRLSALDGVFSKWVRYSHPPVCVTCGAMHNRSELQAGHFWKRQHQATRFDPCNVHPQCVRCNKYRGGAEAEHAAYILRTYGKEVFDELEMRHRQIKKWTREEVESMILYYKQQVSELTSAV